MKQKSLIKIILKYKEIIILLGAVFFWFFTINNLPQRVTKNEQDIKILRSDMQQLKQDLIVNNTKTDMILQSVTRIENRIFDKHTK